MPSAGFEPAVSASKRSRPTPETARQLIPVSSVGNLSRSFKIRTNLHRHYPLHTMTVLLYVKYTIYKASISTGFVQKHSGPGG
jgi:hypothetical protein